MRYTLTTNERTYLMTRLTARPGLRMSLWARRWNAYTYLIPLQDVGVLWVQGKWIGS
jgi:hypothetical protein